MSDRAYAKVQIQQKTLTGSSPSGHLLQRTCACGETPGIDGQCTGCWDKRLTLYGSRRGFEAPSASAVAQEKSLLSLTLKVTSKPANYGGTMRYTMHIQRAKEAYRMLQNSAMNRFDQI
jgi:hypothetical protein